MSIMLHITYNYALQTLCGAPHNVCNDAAQDLDLPPNRLYGYDGCIAGSFIVCGDSDNGLISLTDEQMAYYEKLYHYPIAFLPMVHSFLPMKCTPEQYEQFQRDGNKLKIKPIDHGER